LTARPSRAVLAAGLFLVAVSGVAKAQTSEDVVVVPEASSDGSQHKSWWRSAVRGSEDLLGRLNNEGWFPQLKNFSDNTGPAPGIVYFRPRLGDTGLSFYASYAHSFRGDTLREVRFGRIPSNGRRPPRRGDYEVLAPSEIGENGAFYYVALRQRDLPSSELFLPSTGASGSTLRYHDTEALYDAVAGYRFSPRFFGSGARGSAEARRRAGR
jgi:hypothetical protein